MRTGHILPLLAAMTVSALPLIAEARPGGAVRGEARASVHGARPAGAHAAPAARAGGGQVARPAGGNRQAVAGNRSARVSNQQAYARGDTVRGGNRVNTGNVNIGNNVNVNVDHDNGWGWGWDDDHHPIAAGVAFGTAAAVTSAALGSRYYSLPPACAPYPYAGFTYYSCGGVYYAPQYEGDRVVYVVVERPG